jgi:hypothetical protein
VPQWYLQYRYRGTLNTICKRIITDEIAPRFREEVIDGIGNSR